MNNFTAKQKEIVARKLGYDGPMHGFDEFLDSSPALGMKYAALSDKFSTRMAKGGMARKKYQEGGAVTGGGTTPKATREQVLNAFKSNTKAKLNPTEEDINYWMNSGLDSFNTAVDQSRANNPALAAEIDTARGNTTIGGGVTTQPPTPPATTATGAPNVPGATTYTAAQTATPTGATVDNAGATTQATVTKNAEATQMATPATVAATTAGVTGTKEDIKTAQEKMTAETGTVSEGAKVTAATGTVSDKAVAQTQKVGEEFIKPVTAGTRTTGAGELVEAVTQAPVVKAEAAQTAAPTKVEAIQGTVKANELVTAAQIAEKDMAQATAITAAGLAPDAKAVAAKLDKFTVDDGTLAQAAQGDVNALSTVQGQLAELMKSFDDGATPAWAAGAIRGANAVMAARGLGGSSMAGAAIFQAAMESALPIAQQDAQVFQQMGIANLNNRQQTALANAAAQQGLSLANLNNEQQARLQNAANSFALQSQNLSNMQQTMLANTQIRATLQGQNLSNQQQAAVVNAARYAEMANINLNNLQQTALGQT